MGYVRPLRVLDLFSGIGGFSLGLEMCGGFITVAFAESNAWCRKLLEQRYPATPIFEDVRLVDYEGRIDVITSGDPCQRDSRANAKRDGGSLWPYTFELVRRYRPIYVLRENVSGNLDTGTAQRVENDLRAEGYEVRTYHLSGLSIGTAHNRARTWTLAYTDGARQQKRDYAAEPGAPEEWQHTMHVGPHGVYWMGTEPPVLRRTDDVPYRVDRIRALGNSAPPAKVSLFGRAILEHYLNG